MALLFLILGLGLLYVGADILVKGSSHIALKLGIKPIIVGLTVVAFGTSTPELMVSMKSAISGSGSIALGNVIGSNICNIALIIGIAAIIRPIPVDIKTLFKDVFLMVTISILTVIFVLNSPEREITQIEGIILFSLFISYIIYTVIDAKSTKVQIDKQAVISEMPKIQTKTWLDILFIVGGFVGLIYGSSLFVDGAITIARYFNVSEAVIGLTLVAFGTSLPELATTIVAALKGENEIAFGNAVGSNIFNILLVLGLTSAIVTVPAADINYIDLGVMLLTAIIIIPMAKINFKISRIEGIVLILFYVAYIAYKAIS